MNRTATSTVLFRRKLVNRLLLPTLLVSLSACDRSPTDPFSAAEPESAVLAKGGPKAATNYKGTILFSLEASGTANIHRINPDGTNLVQLTSSAGYNNMPAWSPKYDKVAFTSTREGGFTQKIFLMNGDGTGVVRVTNPGVGQSDMYPNWSPDGTRIAFVRSDRKLNPTTGNYFIVHDLHILTIKSGAVKRITNLEALALRFPHWSPDGKQILFTRSSATGLNLFTVGIDGSQLTQLTNCMDDCQRGRYSPDGSTIVLLKNTKHIVRIPAAGGSPVILYNDGNTVGAPSYSVDGTEIVFQRFFGSGTDLWRKGVVGSWHLTRVAEIYGLEREPAWSR